MVLTTMKKDTLNIKNRLCGAYFGVMTALMCSQVAVFAANPWGSAQQTITTQVNDFKNAVLAVANPIATAVLILCFILAMVSKNQKKVEGYWDWCKRILLCLVAANCVGFLIKIAEELGKAFTV